MPEDAYRHVIASPLSPAEQCFAVAPSDTLELPVATKALYVGAGGDVRLVALGDTAAVTFRNVAAGTILDVRARTVLATGTTASSIVGLA